ncbi:MAG: hypothetical protein JSU00_15680 [Acidobacteria bacterium]|nr:hypothetical protein [Acidobacteriota bacterium]
MKSKLLIGVIAVLLVLSWAYVGWLHSRGLAQQARIAALEGELRDARVKIAAAVSAPPPPSAAVEAPKPAAPAHAEHPAVVERAPDPELETLRAKLQDAAAGMAKLQARVTDLETQTLNLTADRARFSAAENEARTKANENAHTIEVMNTDRAAADRRMRELEAEVSRLRQQSAAADQRSSQYSQVTTELRDITRRQQTYVTNILRRYREVTDIFRSLPDMVDQKGNGPAVARIQTAISMADEDVRQLNDLSARLGRVEKRLSAAK